MPTGSGVGCADPASAPIVRITATTAATASTARMTASVLRRRGAVARTGLEGSSASASASGVGSSSVGGSVVVTSLAATGAVGTSSGAGNTAVGASPARSALNRTAASPAVGRRAGSRAVIARNSSAHAPPSTSGITGSRVSRAVADSTAVPGNSRRPVRHSSSTSPSEYTSVAAVRGRPPACSGLR